MQNKKFKTKSAKSAIFHHFTQSAEQKVQNYISPLKVQKKKCNISYVKKLKEFKRLIFKNADSANIRGTTFHLKSDPFNHKEKQSP